MESGFGRNAPAGRTAQTEPDATSARRRSTEPFYYHIPVVALVAGLLLAVTALLAWGMAATGAMAARGG